MLRQMAKLKRRAKLAWDRPGGLSHKWPNSRGERSLLMSARVPGAEAPRHAGGVRHEAYSGRWMRWSVTIIPAASWAGRLGMWQWVQSRAAPLCMVGWHPRQTMRYSAGVFAKLCAG